MLKTNSKFLPLQKKRRGKPQMNRIGWSSSHLSLFFTRRPVKIVKPSGMEIKEMKTQNGARWAPEPVVIHGVSDMGSPHKWMKINGFHWGYNCYKWTCNPAYNWSLGPPYSPSQSFLVDEPETLQQITHPRNPAHDNRKTTMHEDASPAKNIHFTLKILILH